MGTCNVVVDLSHNNATVDLVAAKSAGILGVIHKATQGTGFSDPAYSARRQAASDAGLLWGAYHFATGGDPAAQAKFFLRTASASDQDLIVLDFEQNEGNPANTMTLEQAHTFIKTVQDATGATPGLYGGAYLKQQLNGGEDDILQSCWLWWAQYGPAPSIPGNWSDWTLWQYTDGHHGNPPLEVDGIGPCDRDQYQGTTDDLQAKWVTGSLAG
jgi:lysozyme